MKKIRTALKFMAAVGLLAMVFQGCKDSSNGDNGPTSLDIESITVGEADLNGSQPPSDVAVDASIEIEFNTEIQASSATADNITLTQDYDGKDIPLQISADGPVLTITPEANLGGGILYEFQMSGLVNVDEQPIDQITRSFTTAGTFSPSGMIANWTFEESAEDVVGNYDPASGGVIDINYVDSRNDEAGLAAEFNGSTSIIEIPGAPDLATTGKFTLSMWLKPDTTDGAANYAIGAGGFNGFEVELNRTSLKMAAQYMLQDGSSSAAQDLWVDGTGNISVDGWTYSKDYGDDGLKGVIHEQWTHFVFQYDSESKIGRVYINGELAKRQNYNEYPTDHALYQAGDLTFNSQEGLGENMAIGYYSDRSTTIYSWADYSDPDTPHYAGLMDDIKIYHKVLTETEIQLMYNSES